MTKQMKKSGKTEELPCLSMWSFSVLQSSPFSDNAPTEYKGLYRLGPPLPEQATEEYRILWERYSSAWGVSRLPGITTELTVSELERLRVLSQEQSGRTYELIWCGDTHSFPCSGTFYGIDVVGAGGYSLLGDGTLVNFDRSIPLSHLRQIVAGKLNQYGLFFDEENARVFCDALWKINRTTPTAIDCDEWRIAYIFRLEDTGTVLSS